MTAPARLTDAEVAELEAALERVPPGPWGWGAPPLKHWRTPDDVPAEVLAALVMSRNLAPRLLAERREMRKLLAEAANVVYGDDAFIPDPDEEDVTPRFYALIQRLKAALGEGEKGGG